MRKEITQIIAACFGLLLLVMPAFASADGVPTQPTAAQLLTRVAALEALEIAASTTSPVSCAALFSAPSVAIGRTVALAWGSFGATDQTKDTENMWPQNGASMLSFSRAGTWTYDFTFYSASGSSTTCTAQINVVAA